MAWAFGPEPISWPGATVATGHLLDWERVSGGTVRFEANAGVVDPSGNAATPAARLVPVIDVGTARAAHVFEEGPIDVTSELDAEILTGEAASVCEEGACLRVGLHNWGLRGLLSREGATKVRMRYRVLSNTDRVTAFVMEVAVPGAGRGSARGVTYLTEIEAEPGEPRYASAWSNALVFLPPSESNLVGFAIGVRCPPSPHYCDGGDPAANCFGGYTLLVERIAAE